MIQTGTKKLTLAAMFFAIGIILPFFIGQIPLVGQMLLPMHIPVLLCGLNRWLAVWTGNRIFPSAGTWYALWNAGTFS